MLLHGVAHAAARPPTGVLARAGQRLKGTEEGEFSTVTVGLFKVRKTFKPILGRTGLVRTDAISRTLVRETVDGMRVLRAHYGAVISKTRASKPNEPGDITADRKWGKTFWDLSPDSKRVAIRQMSSYAHGASRLLPDWLTDVSPNNFRFRGEGPRTRVSGWIDPGVPPTLAAHLPALKGEHFTYVDPSGQRFTLTGGGILSTNGYYGASGGSDQ
jgi:hypothetical protein